MPIRGGDSATLPNGFKIEFVDKTTSAWQHPLSERSAKKMKCKDCPSFEVDKSSTHFGWCGSINNRCDNGMAKSVGLDFECSKQDALPSDNKPLTKCSCNNHNIRVMCLGCGGHVEDL